MKLHEIVTESLVDNHKAFWASDIEITPQRFIEYADIKDATFNNGVINVDNNVYLESFHLDEHGTLLYPFGTANFSFQFSNESYTKRQYAKYFGPLTELTGCPTKVGHDFTIIDGGFTSLKGGPVEVGSDYTIVAHTLTSLKGAPKIVNGIFEIESMLLKSFEHAPRTIKGDFKLENTGFTSLVGINDCIDFIGGYIYLPWHIIEEGGLGLILINGLTVNSIDDPEIDLDSAFAIISKYLGRPDDIFECQNELIENGFEEYAKL